MESSAGATLSSNAHAENSDLIWAYDAENIWTSAARPYVTARQDVMYSIKNYELKVS